MLLPMQLALKTIFPRHTAYLRVQAQRPLYSSNTQAQLSDLDQDFLDELPQVVADQTPCDDVLNIHIRVEQLHTQRVSLVESTGTNGKVTPTRAPVILRAAASL